MNGVTFDEVVERYAIIAGIPIDEAESQMREALHESAKSLLPSAEALGRLITDSMACGLNPHFVMPRIRPSRRIARRRHSRKTKQAR